MLQWPLKQAEAHRGLFFLEIEMKTFALLFFAVCSFVYASVGGVAVALIDYQTQVARLVQDDAGHLDVDDRDSAITAALARYSHDKPRQVVEDVVALGGYYLPLPQGWDLESSHLVDVEYPIGNMPPSLLSGSYIYRAPNSTNIAVSKMLAAGEDVRLTYTAPHVLDGNSDVDTIPISDREAVASYAAAALLDQLATRYSGDSDSTIQADSVNHADQGRNFAARANKLRARYFDHLGIDPNNQQVAAATVVDLDFMGSRGRDRLFHSGKYR